MASSTFRARSCSSGRWIAAISSSVGDSTRSFGSVSCKIGHGAPSVRTSFGDTLSAIHHIMELHCCPHSLASSLCGHAKPMTRSFSTWSTKRSGINFHRRQVGCLEDGPFFPAPGQYKMQPMSSAVIAPTALDPDSPTRIFTRISRLPKWRGSTNPIQSLASCNSSLAPSNSMLLKVYYELINSEGVDPSSSDLPTRATDKVTRICKDHYSELAANDFDFILKIIRECSTSQQQFWESMATLVRYSISPQGLRSGKALATTVNGNNVQVHEFWPQAVADTISSAFWSESSSAFVEQIEQAWDREFAISFEREYTKTRNTATCPLSRTSSLVSETEKAQPTQWTRHPRSSPLDAECLAHVLIDALLLKKHTKRALSIYSQLSELGFMMPSRLLASIIRIAVDCQDRQQLERIGKMLLEHEQRYSDSPLAHHPHRSLNRPLLMPSKLMESFIHGASECELYDIVRAVFQRGLLAGKVYRTSTYTMVLNTYSVKDFGFDVVAAAEAYRKKGPQGKVRRHSRQRNDGFDEPRRSALAESEGNEAGASRVMAPADPTEIDMYISSMETLGIKPSATTLNVLVKLYLEMAQYKVQGAPPWMSAFRRYNPLGLSPDLTTNNTLLAYYEKHKDLDTMRKIYNEMASKDSSKNNSRPARTKVVPMKNPLEFKITDEARDEVQNDRQSKAPPQDNYSPSQISDLPRTQHLRSNRDVFTYNTMLHALLQHAVETKDLASIGQCFHDMELDGIQADTVTFNTNILYHITRGDVAAAMQVFRSMDLASVRDSSLYSKSKPVKSTPSARLPQYNRDMKLEQTPSLHLHSHPEAASDMPSRPVPDIVTLTSLISGFGRAKQMDRAAQLFKDLTNRYGLEPNLKTYSTLAAALHRAGDHAAAESLWDIVLKDDSNSSRKNDKGDREYGYSTLPLEKEDMSEQLAENNKQESPLTAMERHQIEARRHIP